MYLSSSSLAVFLLLVVASTDGQQPGLRGGRNPTIEDGELPIVAEDITSTLLVPVDQRLEQDSVSILPPIVASPDVEGAMNDGEEDKEEPSDMSFNSYLRSKTPEPITTSPPTTGVDVDSDKMSTESDGDNTRFLDEEPMDPSDFLGWTPGGVDHQADKKVKPGVHGKKKSWRKRSKQEKGQNSTVNSDDSSEGKDLLFQGDIIPDYDQIMNEYGPDTMQKLEEAGVHIEPSKTSGIAKNLQVNRRWNTRVGDVVQIPYSISSSFNSVGKQRIQQALTDIAQRSGVVAFIPRTSQGDYVQVVDGGGCSSYVGRIGGAQQLTLAINGCLQNGIIQHEFLHALGFEHEQSRPDRDSFVTINYQNIKEGSAFNFDKQTSSNHLGSGYDFGSVMHYGATDFSKNGQKTISASRSIGQREGADAEDIFQVQLLYQCVSRARTVTEFRSNPCTGDCKCWESASGCNGDDNACQGSLVCSNNQCVQPGSGGGGGGSGGGVANNFFEFRNKENSNLCLDVPNGDTTNGKIISLSPCNGSQSQKFSVDQSGQIMSAINLNKCLVGDAGNTSRGTQLWIHDCFANDTRFQFFFYTSGRIRPQMDTSQCVGPSRSRTVGGNPIVQFWDCYDGALHQQWNWNLV